MNRWSGRVTEQTVGTDQTAKMAAVASQRQRVSVVVSALSHPEHMYDALDELSEMVGQAFGEDGARLGAAVRTGSGVFSLTRLLRDEDADARLQALHVLANLCSDAVDPGSEATKQVSAWGSVEPGTCLDPSASPRRIPARLALATVLTPSVEPHRGRSA